MRIGIRDVEKLQGESYRGLSFCSGDSPVETNLNMTGAFQAYEAGRPYKTRSPQTKEADSRESAREKLDSLAKESRAHREAQVPHAPRTEMETAAKLSPDKPVKPKVKGPER